MQREKPGGNRKKKTGNLATMFSAMEEKARPKGKTEKVNSSISMVVSVI